MDRGLRGGSLERHPHFAVSTGAASPAKSTLRTAELDNGRARCLLLDFPSPGSGQVRRAVADESSRDESDLRPTVRTSLLLR